MARREYNLKFYLKIFWIVFASPFLVLFILFLLIGNDKLGKLPSFEQLENPNSMLASEVYSEDDTLLGSFYLENRTAIKFEDLSPNLVNALIATEDIRFKKHSGIDGRGLGRVLFKTILQGKKAAGGGSTITQQLAKNLYGRDSINYNNKVLKKIVLGITKFKEWVTAVKIERNYTKDEILVMYLNTVFFGSNSYGIKAAAKTFFNTTPDKLKVEEAALLVGLVNAPSKYSPVINPERAMIRRNVVLSQMYRYDFLTESKYDSLLVLPIQLNYKIQDYNEGLGTYFRANLKKMMTKGRPEREAYSSYQRFKNDSTEWNDNPLYGWCNKNFKPDGSPYNLYKDGLKIYSTINSKMQQYAEDAVKEYLGDILQNEFEKGKGQYKRFPFSDDLTPDDIDRIIDASIRRSARYRLLKKEGLPEGNILKTFNMPTKMTLFSWKGNIDTILTPLDSIVYYKKFLRAGFMSMDPYTGYVKAYIGGPNFKYLKYDAVTQGKRQIGSTIKPFLYTLAMQEGLSPCYKVPNVPTTFYLNDTTWTPKNSGESKYEGMMVTLKWGLANSVNYISAWVMKQFNPQSVIDIMQKMGITSYIDPVPSLFLGTSEISLYEMVGAYSAYVNKGVYIKPLFVTRIEDKNGNVISTFQAPKLEAISEKASYLMTNLLKGVVDFGTASRLRWKYEFENEIGGKTGTTQNHSDGWFIGLTPRLVSGVWSGWEDRGIHFKDIGLGQGASMALPIWAYYMKKVYADESLGISMDDIFEKPLQFSTNMDCNEPDNTINRNSFEDELFY